MSTVVAALAAYADMLADPDVPSAKIAELAGVDVADVELARGAAVDPQPEPEAEGAAEPAPKPRGRSPKAKAEPPAKMPAAPASVRATKKALILGPTGRSLLVKKFDVFNGELAAWMWTKHREIVAPLGG